MWSKMSKSHLVSRIWKIKWKEYLPYNTSQEFHLSFHRCRGTAASNRQTSSAYITTYVFMGRNFWFRPSSELGAMSSTAINWLAQENIRTKKNIWSIFMEQPLISLSQQVCVSPVSISDASQGVLLRNPPSSAPGMVAGHKVMGKNRTTSLNTWSNNA